MSLPRPQQAPTADRPGGGHGERGDNDGEGDGGDRDLDPSSAVGKAPLDSWPGNLPCVTGPRSGCENHNRYSEAISHDKSLLPHQSTTSRLLNSLFAPRGSPPVGALAPRRIYSPVPRSPATTATLPQVHPNIPYRLAFYHVAALARAAAASQTNYFAHSHLECSGKGSGSVLFPQPLWRVAPCMVNGSAPRSPHPDADPAKNTCLLEVHASLALTDDDHVYSKGFYSKHHCRGSAFRGYAPCPHMTLDFKTVRVKRAFRLHDPQPPASVRVEYGLRNVLGQEFAFAWGIKDGVEDGQSQGLNCGLCWTDSRVRFSLRMAVVPHVEIVVIKDLGAGLSVDDAKWRAAMGLEPVERGNMRPTAEVEAGVVTKMLRKS